MPISPENEARYLGGGTKSPEWLEFRRLILARAGNACERCKVTNGTVIMRGTGHNAGIYMLITGDTYSELDGAYLGCSRMTDYNAGKASKVVLTIMHLDQNPENNDGWRPGQPVPPLEGANCIAGCQKCHNAHDAPHRRKNAERTRRSRGGQGDLLS